MLQIITLPLSCPMQPKTTCTALYAIFSTAAQAATLLCFAIDLCVNITLSQLGAYLAHHSDRSHIQNEHNQIPESKP
jgi:hypothetical protein